MWPVDDTVHAETRRLYAVFYVILNGELQNNRTVWKHVGHRLVRIGQMGLDSCHETEVVFEAAFDVINM
jgi:hypothetical protein